MIEFVTNVDPDTRTLLDIPAPGHPYWTDQTIADMEVRYPGIDMSAYRGSVLRPDPAKGHRRRIVDTDGNAADRG